MHVCIVPCNGLMPHLRLILPPCVQCCYDWLHILGTGSISTMNLTRKVVTEDEHIFEK